MLETILPVLSVVFALIVSVICILIGIKRGCFNSALRLLFFLAAGVGSFFLTRFLAGELSQILLDYLPKDAQILQTPSIAAILEQLATGILSPLLYPIVLFVVDKLTFLIYVPVRKHFADWETLHTFRGDRAAGAVLGLVLAAAIVLVCVMPISGIVQYADSTLSSVSDTALNSLLEDQLPEELTAQIHSLAVLPTARMEYGLSGWLFRELSSPIVSTTQSLLSLMKVADAFSQIADPSVPIQSVDILPVLENLTPQAAEITSNAISAALEISLPEEQKEVATLAGSCISDMLTSVADASKLPQEELEEEVAAIGTVIQAVTSGDISDPGALIEAGLESKIITDVIAEHSEEIKESLGGILPQDSDSLDTYQDMLDHYSDNSDIPPEALNAVAAILGLPESYG